MHITYINRIFTVYKIIGTRFGIWIKPIFIGFVIFFIRLLIFLFMKLDYLFFPKIKSKKIKSPIIIVGNPRSGTTFLQRFLSSNGFGRGSELWQMLYPSILLQKFIKPILPILEYISPAKHHSTDAHKTSLSSVETDDVSILFKYFDGFFLYGFILCWANEDYFSWVDPKIRDNSKRDHRWLESIWKRILISTDSNRVVAKLFSLSSNAPKFIERYPDSKILYMVRDPLSVIPSGLSLVTGVLDKMFGFWNMPKERRDLFIQKLYKGLVELLNRFCIDWNNNKINKNNVFIVHFDRMMNDFDGLMSDVIKFTNHNADKILIDLIKETSEKQKQYKSKHKYDLEKFGLNENKIKNDCKLFYETFLA